MKWLIWFFLLLNAGLLGYFQLTPLDRSVQRQALHPEHIQLLTEQEAAALQSATAPAEGTASTTAEAMPNETVPDTTAPDAKACYEWGLFGQKKLQEAQALLAGLGVQHTVQPISREESRRFWVFIPAKPSLAAAQAKLEELKQLGVSEMFIVQEAPWRNAISLGLFKDEALAIKRLADLKTLGVTSAQKALRSFEKDQSTLMIRNISGDVLPQIEAHLTEFSGTEIKRLDCQ